MNFVGRRDGSSLQNRGWTQLFLSGQVSFNHPIDGICPVGMGGSKDFIEDVKVNAKALNVVLDGSQTEIDEVHLLCFDENVVARQIAVGHRFSVKASDTFSDPVEDATDGAFLSRFVVEDIDERCSCEMLNDELATFVIQVPYGRNRESGFSSPNEQSGLADHPTNTQTVVQIRVAPRPGASLFPNGWLAKPGSFPHFRLCAEVQTLKGCEDHATTNKGFFLKIHLHPFLEKGLVVGQE